MNNLYKQLTTEEEREYLQAKSATTNAIDLFEKLSPQRKEQLICEVLYEKAFKGLSWFLGAVYERKNY